MINSNLVAVEYEFYKDFYETRVPFKAFDPDNYSFIYFGRRYLTEKEHLVLVPHGSVANLPSYEGGVGYIKLKDMTNYRTLTCKKCSTLCDNLESFFIHEDNSSYVCPSCNPQLSCWEEVKSK